MNTYVASIIRTWVPIGVGLALTWVAGSIGFVITDDSKTNLVAVMVGAVTAAYYALVRLAEKRFPQIGWLLGLAKQPVVYSPTPPVTPSV